MHGITAQLAEALPQRVLLTPEQSMRTLEFLAPPMRGTLLSETQALAVFARCCLHLMPSNNLPGKAREEAEQFARGILAHANPTELGLDPLILASHYGLLRAAGVEVPSFTQVIASLDQELRALPLDVRCAPRLRHTASLMRACGIGTAPPRRPAFIRELVSAPVKLAKQPGDALQDIVDHLCADPDELDADTADMLCMIALAELRDYRADLACRILRLALLSGHRPRYLEEAIDFIMLQRCADGSYGFLDPFRDQGASEEDRLRHFQLPMTLNAVWVFLTYEQQQAAAGTRAARAQS